MGKSGKKIKSDRINTLRKQYDAFLEDDKKRKHRNDYILGRLEEIRSSSALMTIQHKENSHANNDYYSSRGVTSLNYLAQVDNSLKTIPNKNIIAKDIITQQFEPSLLREISKKFILIPRHQSSFSNEVNYPLTESADTDWKSKYNILNELKKSEKETVSDNLNFEEPQKSIVPIQESLNKCDNKIDDYIKTKDDMQDLNVNTHKNYEESNRLNLSSIEKDNFDRSIDINVRSNDGELTQKIENKHLLHNVDYISNDQYSVSNNNIPQIEVSEKQTENKFEISKNKEGFSNNQNCDNISLEIKNIDKNKVEEEDMEKINLEKFENKSTEEKYKLEEYINQEGKDDVTQNVDRHEKTTDDHLSQNLNDDNKNVVEMNPELSHVEKNKSNEVPIISGETGNPEILELENEQNQMFYTEDSDTKYDYMENNADTQGYPLENENYINEQYSYHDESQLEQPYTSEINEHEESTEQYDPNYEQHYTNNYENMNVPQYDNQQYDQQQYEINNTYENQQSPLVTNVNYEEIQPNNDTFEHVVPENTEISYQNQDENVYNYGNENYETQQYDTNDQQEYSTINPNEQSDYPIEQEYVQSPAEQDTVNDLEKVLDTEDGYINNQNTILTTNTENNIVPDIPSSETDPNVNVS